MIITATKLYLLLNFCFTWKYDKYLDAGLWTLDSGRWTLDSVLWTLDAGRWTLDAEC